MDARIKDRHTKNKEDKWNKHRRDTTMRVWITPRVIHTLYDFGGIEKKNVNDYPRHRGKTLKSHFA